MINNIFKRRVVTYRQACELVRDEYLRNKEKYDKYTDHVSLYNLVINLDLSKDYIIIPAKRGHLNTNLKYPIAELIWYTSEDRKIDKICEFGPIWKNMVDENGLVQSNYGYQTARILKNKFGDNYLYKAANELTNKGQLVINILDETNITCSNDTPCNNVFIYNYNKNTREITCSTIARSLDLVFGYPYDVFYAQVLAHKLINELKDKDIWISKIQYIPINGHIYLKDLVQDKLDKWDKNYIKDEFILLDPKILLDKRINKKVCQNYDNSDRIRLIRKNLISDYGRGLKVIKQNKTNNIINDNFINTRILNISKDYFDEEACNKIIEIFSRLKNKEFNKQRFYDFINNEKSVDRKVVIYNYDDNNSKLIYFNRIMQNIPEHNSLIISVVDRIVI